MTKEDSARPDMPADTATEGPADRVERIVFECLERWNAEGEETVRRACREHPDMAVEIRARLEGLRQAGLLPGQDEDSPIPEALGEFRLVRRLGGGGMGVVYLAEQTSLRRMVALKLIRPEHHYFPGSRARFRREVEAVARLNHKGIVPIYTVGEERGIPFFAMEHVEGCTLAEALIELQGSAPEKLSGRDLALAISSRTGIEVPADCRAFDGSWAATSARLALDLTEALQHAHDRGVVHRDVKPSNVMVTVDGRVMLLDFGLARAEGSARITMTTSTIGSLAYMPPEQAQGQNRDPGPTTDVYSLGITLYELFTLCPAYLGTTTEETRRRVIEARPRPVRSINPAVPRDAETVCLKAMDREPGRRYQSATELGRDLRNVLELRPIEARRPGPGLRALRFVQRRPALSAAMVLAFVLVVLVPTAFALYEKGKREAADREKYAATILAASASLHVNEVREAKRLLASCPETLRGWEWRHLWAASDSSADVLRGHVESILAVATSPSGDLIASGGFEGMVLLRDARSGVARRLQVPPEMRGYSTVASSLAFDPTGKRLYAGFNDGAVLEWDVATGTPAVTARTHKREEGPKRFGVPGLVFHPEGKRFFTVSWIGEVRVWDAGSDRNRVLGRQEDHRLLSLAIDGAAKRLAVGTDRGFIRIQDASSGNILANFRAHEAAVRSVAFSEDGTRIASASDDGTVRLSSAEGAESQVILRGHEGSVFAVAFCPDGERLVSSGDDRTVRVWSIRARSVVAVRRGHDDGVTSLVFLPGTEELYSGSEDGTVRRWDLARSEVVVAGDRGPGWITAVAFSRDGARLATGHIMLKLVLRDPDTGSARKEIPFDNRAVHDVAFSPDGKRIVAGGFTKETNKEILMWDSESGNAVPEFRPTTSTVNSIAWSPDGSRVVSGSEDGVVRIWNTGDGGLACTLEGHRGPVTCVEVSRDGSRIVSASKDRTLRVWDFAGRTLATLVGHPGVLHAAAFAPDGRRIASGGADRTVRIWDVDANRCVGELHGHDHLVSALAFSPDGRRLVSGSWDGTLRVWDPDELRPLCILRGHGYQVTSVAFSPDGARILSGAQDGTLRAWDSREPALKERAESSPSRPASGRR